MKNATGTAIREQMNAVNVLNTDYDEFAVAYRTNDKRQKKNPLPNEHYEQNFSTSRNSNLEDDFQDPKASTVHCRETGNTNTAPEKSKVASHELPTNQPVPGPIHENCKGITLRAWVFQRDEVMTGMMIAN